MTKFYRKRPLVVQAWNNNSGEPMPDWARLPMAINGLGGSMWCLTNHGFVEVKHGDWLIKGLGGEVYPCADEVFKATYEETP